MSDQWMWALLIGGELLAVVLLLLLVSWLRNLAARRRDRKAIRKLVAETKKLKDQRREQISAFMSERFGLRDEVLDRAVRGIYMAELQLIQAFANIYLQRDAIAASGFRRQVEGSVEPYWELSSDGSSVDTETVIVAETAQGTAQASDDEPVLDDAELARLRGENVRLSEELRVTMDTMSRMLNEYSNIFATESEENGMTVLDDSEVEGGRESGEEPQADAGENPSAVDAQDVGDQTVDADETASEIDDPDELLAAVQKANVPDEAIDERAITLDPEMQDLSLDDESPDADSKSEQAAAAERQRVIDADS